MEGPNSPPAGRGAFMLVGWLLRGEMSSLIFLQRNMQDTQAPRQPPREVLGNVLQAGCPPLLLPEEVPLERLPAGLYPLEHPSRS